MTDGAGGVAPGNTQLRNNDATKETKVARPRQHSFLLAAPEQEEAPYEGLEFLEDA